eukprot:s3382_g7.t1
MIFHGLLCFPALFLQTSGVWYVDNVAALMALVKGRSESQELDVIAQSMHLLLFHVRCNLWFEWVQSHSNWADAISRLGLQDSWHKEHRPVCRIDLEGHVHDIAGLKPPQSPADVHCWERLKLFHKKRQVEATGHVNHLHEDWDDVYVNNSGTTTPVMDFGPAIPFERTRARRDVAEATEGLNSASALYPHSTLRTAEGRAAWTRRACCTAPRHHPQPGGDRCFSALPGKQAEAVPPQEAPAGPESFGVSFPRGRGAPFEAHRESGWEGSRLAGVRGRAVDRPCHVGARSEQFVWFLASPSWAGLASGSLTANVQTRDLLRLACCFQRLGRRTQVKLISRCAPAIRTTVSERRVKLVSTLAVLPASGKRKTTKASPEEPGGRASEKEKTHFRTFAFRSPQKGDGSRLQGQRLAMAGAHTPGNRLAWGKFRPGRVGSRFFLVTMGGFCTCAEPVRVFSLAVGALCQLAAFAPLGRQRASVAERSRCRAGFSREKPGYGCYCLGPTLLPATLPSRPTMGDRPESEITDKLTVRRPPDDCPGVYLSEVQKIEENVRLVLARHQVPWLVLYVMASQGFVTSQDWAGRWEEGELRKAAPKLGFRPGMNGYDENTSVLTSIRLENAIDQFKLLKKRKLAEVDIHSVEDYKAMIGRGDRQEMRAAYLAKFGVEPERDHMLGVLKRVLYRGEFLSGPQPDLNKIVANHPKDGEVKFQWIHEESNRVQNEKHWKLVLMIWRTSLLMVVATCTGPSSIKLTKAELDEFYTFLFGDTIMGREPAP